MHLQHTLYDGDEVRIMTHGRFRDMMTYWCDINSLIAMVSSLSGLGPTYWQMVDLKVFVTVPHVCNLAVFSFRTWRLS